MCVRLCVIKCAYRGKEAGFTVSACAQPGLNALSCERFVFVHIWAVHLSPTPASLKALPYYFLSPDPRLCIFSSPPPFIFSHLLRTSNMYACLYPAPVSWHWLIDLIQLFEWWIWIRPGSARTILDPWWQLIDPTKNIRRRSCLPVLFIFSPKSLLDINVPGDLLGFKDSTIQKPRPSHFFFFWQNLDELADSLTKTSGVFKPFFFLSSVCCLIKVAARCACCWANHLPLNACTGVCPSDGKRMRVVFGNMSCIWWLFATALVLPWCLIYYLEKFLLVS